MAVYTTQLKSLIEMKFNIGLDDYPLFDENYRPILNQKIIDYYYFREIGFETAALFRQRLKSKMNLIMPKYNRLYKMLAENDDLFSNTNLTERLDRESNVNAEYETLNNQAVNSNREQSGTDTRETNNSGAMSDTPQSKLTNIPESIIDVVHASNASWERYVDSFTAGRNDDTNTNSNSSQTGESGTDTTENYVKTLKGNNGRKYTYEMLIEIQNGLEDIDQQIVNELWSLFMGVW